jgi:phospholipid/cholesterol/gamma-HCH transport system permease protein
MRLNGEIDALIVMGISPIRFIVAPALLGLLISLPILVAVATVASLTAGQLYIEATIGIASQAFWADVLSVVTMMDLAHCFGKAVLFALLIALIGIVMGLGVSGGSAVLGRATTSSVVTCIGAIIAADTAVALLL